MNILQQIEDYLVTCGDQIAKVTHIPPRSNTAQSHTSYQYPAALSTPPSHRNMHALQIYRYYSASAGGGNLSTMSLREYDEPASAFSLTVTIALAFTAQ